MKQIKLTKDELGVWRSMLAAPTRGQAWLTAVLFFLSCLVLPLSDHPAVSLFYILCCVVFYYALSHSFFSLLYYAVPSFLLYGISSFLPGIPNPLLLPCAFLALLMGGSCGAFLFTHLHTPKKHWYLFAMPLVTYGAAALITGDPVRGLLTLLPLALAVAGALCLWFCVPRTSATVLLAVLLTAGLALAGIVTVGAMGGFESNPIPQLADYLRSTVRDVFYTSKAAYAEMGMDLMLSDVDISNTAIMLVNLAPGLILCLCGITAFLVWRSLLQLLLSFRTLPRLPIVLSGFTVSPVSAVVFIASYLLSLIGNYDGATLFGTVCQNLSLVMEPALALIGFGVLFAKERSRSCFSLILAFLLIFLLWRNPVGGLALAAFFGAIHILLARFLPSPDDKGQKGDQ